MMNTNSQNQSQPHFILEGELSNNYQKPQLFNQQKPLENIFYNHFPNNQNNQINQLNFQAPNSFTFNNNPMNMNTNTQSQPLNLFNNNSMPPLNQQQNQNIPMNNNPFNFSNSFHEQEFSNHIEFFQQIPPRISTSNSLGNSLTFPTFPQNPFTEANNHYNLSSMQQNPQNSLFSNIPQEQKIDNSLIIPFNNDNQLVQASSRGFVSIPNNFNFQGYNPKEVTIDPNLFKGETLSDAAKKYLSILEQKLVGNHSLNRVNQYVQLYQANELHDVLLKFREPEEVKAHRVVLLQSPYFERIFQTYKTSISNEQIKILMPEFMTASSFKRVLRYMYYAELETSEIEIMELPMAREILLTAYMLKLYHLMNIVVVRVIIPKMDKQMCVEFLKDSFEREDEKSKITWKSLQHYCLNFFALNSKSILNKYRDSLQDIDPKLMYKIVNKALTKCRDIQHMYELLSLLVESGFSLNLLDLLERIPGIKEKEKKFDIKYIPNTEEISSSLEHKSCYLTELITCEEVYSFNKDNMLCKIIEEKNTMTSELSSKQKQSNLSVHNHLELNLKYNNKYTENIPESNEWPEIKKMDPVYEMKLLFKPEFLNKTILSQSFDSESRSWRLVIDIEEDQKLSVFLLEKGRPSHTPFGSPFKNEFTSVKFLVQFKDAEHEYETLIFHTFANDHSYCIGQRKLLDLSEFNNKNLLHVKVWMMEFPVYSCAIQYLSTRFNDLMKETFTDNDISKIISLKTEERAFLGTQKNNLNQPIHRTEDKRINDENKRRKSIHYLEGNFFRGMEQTHRNNNREEDSDNIDPLAANSINPLGNNRPHNTMNSSHINNLPSLGNQSKVINCNYDERANNNEVDYMMKITGKATNNNNNRDPKPVQRAPTQTKKFETLSPYDFYYLTSSDYLTIEHERFLAYFMYKFTLEKDEDMVNLITYGLRFSFIELSKLFNMARDLLTIRNNSVFINKLDFEINMRIQSTKPFDRPRKFYSTEMYKDWSFKDDLMRWLVESDHHEGYRLKVNELSKIIKSKENQLRNQEEVIIQMSSKIQQMDDAIARHITGEGLKRVRLERPAQGPLDRRNPQQNHGVLSLLKDSCNIF